MILCGIAIGKTLYTEVVLIACGMGASDPDLIDNQSTGASERDSQSITYCGGDISRANITDVLHSSLPASSRRLLTDDSHRHLLVLVVLLLGAKMPVILSARKFDLYRGLRMVHEKMRPSLGLMEAPYVVPFWFPLQLEVPALALAP